MEVSEIHVQYCYDCRVDWETLEETHILARLYNVLHNRNKQTARGLLYSIVTNTSLLLYCSLYNK